MIVLNMGSCTVSAASLAESHLTSRCRFSGHCLLWLLTFNGKTRTSQTTMLPFLRRFSYGNDPTGCLPTVPTTPASLIGEQWIENAPLLVSQIAPTQCCLLQKGSLESKLDSSVKNRQHGLALPLWNSEITGLDERRFLERLEAENAQLRRSVAELLLQMQALRDGAGTLSAYDAARHRRNVP